MSDHRLETERFHLALLEAGDPAHRDLFIHLYTCPDVMARILPPMADDAAEREFERACRANLAASPGHRFWCVRTHVPDAPVGMAALLRHGDEAEIGVMLSRSWWNRGVSSETFVVVIAHGFRVMGLGRITAERLDDDHALIIDRLLGRLGFSRTPERASAPGQCRWELPRYRWSARPDDP